MYRQIEDWKHLRFPVSGDVQTEINEELEAMRDEEQSMEGLI